MNCAKQYKLKVCLMTLVACNNMTHKKRQQLRRIRKRNKKLTPLQRDNGLLWMNGICIISQWPSFFKLSTITIIFYLGLEEHEFRKAFRMNRAAFNELRLLIQPYLHKTQAQIKQAQCSSGSAISLTAKLVRSFSTPTIHLLHFISIILWQAIALRWLAGARYYHYEHSHFAF